MTSVIPVIVCTAALFMAIVLNLAAQPKISKRLTGIMACITAVGGLLIYGYGYACTSESMVLAVVRANFAVCKMYVGANAYADISAAPLFSHVWAQLVFWLLHLAGLFSAASAAVTALGSGLLRRIRLWLYRRRDLAVIYGLREDTLSFGRQLLEQQEKTSLLYVDEAPEGDLAKVADQMGCLLRSDEDACTGSVRFLRSLGLRPGSRRIRLYALQTDEIKNQKYAWQLLQAMEQLQIRREQSALTILAPEDETDSRYQADAGRYGFGTVISVSETELVARTLIRAYPPCERMKFDADGKAENDFHGVIIGAGRIGQAVLRQLVMNGQFYGSNFHLMVFDPNHEALMGRMSMECASMLEQYDIRFSSADGRSARLYRYLAENMERISCIALCTGKDAVNKELADDLRTFLLHRGCRIPVYQCSRRGIHCRLEDDLAQSHSIYTPQMLCSDRIDRTAMVLNQSYCGSGTAEENWAACDYFGRMSSRASADFAPAFLRAAGCTECPQTWELPAQMMENLAKTEHLRWCAFHYAMGFSPMSAEEFDRRAAAYREEKEKTGSSSVRIGKNREGRTHACLIEWDALDALSQAESAITGKQVDYKQKDRNNIQALPAVLQAAEEFS